MSKNDQDEEEGFRFLMPMRPKLGDGFVLSWIHRVGSRCIVEITAEELRVTERFGWLKETKRRRLDDLTSLQVIQPPRPDRNGQFSLASRVADGSQFLFAGGYPEAKLIELESELRRAAAQLKPGAFATTIGKVEIPDAWPASIDEESRAPEAPEAPPRSSQPDSKGVQISTTDEGVSVHVPAQGLLKGSRGMWPIGLAFSGFALLMQLGFLISLFSGNKEAIIPILFIMIFLGVGILLASAGWNMGKRTATLSVTDSVLQIDRTSIMGPKRQFVAREDIKDVRRGPSGLTVNGKSILEVQIHLYNRQKIGLLSQCSDQDSSRIVGALRRALELDQQPEETDTALDELE